MLNWLWKLLGYHVCEEFTQWQRRTSVCQRAATMEEYVWGGVRRVNFAKCWEERSCTLCGKTQQRKLPFGAPSQSEVTENEL